MYVKLVFCKEKFCVSAHVSKLLWKCLKCLEDPGQKNDISSSFWHKSFIQMVKYTFLDKRIV